MARATWIEAALNGAWGAALPELARPKVLPGFAPESIGSRLRRCG